MRGRFTLLASWLVVSVLGCGGAKANAPAEDDPLAQVAAAAAKSDDPKVMEALDRCDKEIAAAELQPPDALSEIQIKACLYALNGQTAPCGKGPKKQLAIKVVIEKTGAVSNAFAVGDGSDSPEAACVIEVVKAGRFPKFKLIDPAVVKFAFTVGTQTAP
ncbi:MAG: hypothetical protein MUC50_24020 [Myxococcota bacterium]|nr:hypothetical protein [Myxococcota bacterium]